MTTKIPWCSQNAGTFDASTAYTYFLNLSPVDLFKRVIGSGATPEDYESLVNRANAGQLRDVLERANIDTDESDAGERTAEAFASAATAAYESFAGFLKNDTTPEELLDRMTALKLTRESLIENDRLFAPAEAGDDLVEIPEEAVRMTDWLLGFIVIEGLSYWTKARALANTSEQGFDILSTEDGENWERIVADGLGDPYNYGARTFTICDGTLFVGTANPYYGAQLWKVNSQTEDDADCPLLNYKDLDLSEWYHDGVHFALEHGIMNGNGDKTFQPEKAATRAELVQILYNLEDRPAAEADLNQFTDINPDKWYVPAIKWAVANKIMEGNGDGTFKPDEPVTREQIAKILFKYAERKGLDTIRGEEPNILDYPDAEEVSDWAVPYIRWAVGAELINGRDEGSKGILLAPQDGAMRAEIATLIMRYCLTYLAE